MHSLLTLLAALALALVVAAQSPLPSRVCPAQDNGYNADPPYLLCRAQYPPASRPRDTFSCIFSPDGSSDSCFFRCIYNADGSLNQDNDAACPVPAPFGVRPSRMKARKFTNDPAPPQPGEAPADSLRRQVNEWRQRDELLRRRPADVKEARAAIKREVGGRDDS